MSESKTFEYEGIDETRHDIRLLTLSPNNESDILSLELKRYPLSEVLLSYHAISYTWGSDKAENLILVNGRQFFLRENAYKFLLHRHTVYKDNTPFWMDTICINQDDTVEKSWQVTMMDRIFASAEKVLIWLGRHSESDNIAESYLRYLKADYEFKLPRCLYTVFARAKAVWNKKDFRSSSTSRVSERLRAIAALRPPMYDLLLADYWERLWIVQEVILAKSCFIIVGSVQVDFTQVFDVLRVEFKESPTSRFFMTLYSSRMEEMSKANKGEGQQQSLASLFELCQTQKCYDHRDRIFGLLGLSKDLEGLSVSYQDCPETLLAKVVRQLIDNGSGRTNAMMKEFPTFCQALDISSQSMSHALMRSKADQEVLTQRDISVEITSDYVLKLLHCKDPQCPKDLSELLDPGDQHITLPSWSDNQSHCFQKKAATSETVKKVTSMSSPDHALLATITFFGGCYVLTADKRGVLRIQQCFGREFEVDILPREYLAGFRIQAKTACTFCIKVSSADLVILHESFDTAQDISKSCKELAEFLLRLGLSPSEATSLDAPT